MADTTQKVAIELRAVDMASNIVRNIGKATGKLLSTVDRITHKFSGIMGKYGGLGTALSLGASVSSAKRYYDQISRIKNVAGGAANEIAAVRYSMVKAGVSASDMENAYVLLAKKGGEMRAHMQHTQKLSRRLGVDFRKGPVESLIQMSAQMKKGKMGYKELNALGGESMLRLRKFLKQGPEAIRRQYAEAQKKMGVVNDQTLVHYSQFKRSVGQISQAWNRVVITVGAKLLPILTKMMEGIASKLDAWGDKAAKFGQFLVDHMDIVVGLAKTFGKIMLANYILMKLTGDGLKGNMMKLLDMAKKSRPGGGKFALAEGVMAGGIRGKAAGGIMSMMDKGGKMGLVGAILAKFFRGAMMLGPIVKLLMKLSMVGAVIALIVNGIRTALNTVKGLKDRMMSAIKGVSREIQTIGRVIGDIFGKNAPLGKFFAWIGEKIVTVFTGAMKIVKGLLSLVSKVAAFIGIIIDNPFRAVNPGEAWAQAGIKADFARYGGIKDGGQNMEQFNAAMDIYDKLSKHKGKVTQKQRDMAARYEKMLRASTYGPMAGDILEKQASVLKKFGPKGAPGERPTYYQDFRGSRFDITQKFAEGFDPDRIALAFANDLSNFGETKLQDNFQPAFTVR